MWAPKIEGTHRCVVGPDYNARPSLGPLSRLPSPGSRLPWISRGCPSALRTEISDGGALNELDGSTDPATRALLSGKFTCFVVYLSIGTQNALKHLNLCAK